MCEVHGVDPTLWMAAAKGLGFHVHSVWFNGAGYQRIILAPGLTPKLSKWGCYRTCHPNVSIIFSEIALLPTNYRYWEAFFVAHVFFVDSVFETPPPLG